MAVFGVQLVLTMIVASFLHKIAPYFSLGRRLMTSGLYRYLPPSDQLLRPHIATPATSTNRTSRRKAISQREKIIASPNSTPAEIIAAINHDPYVLDQNLAVPKSANLKLVTTPLKWSNEVDLLHYANELEFMINLTFAAIVVFCVTSLYFHLRPESVGREYNLSVIWLLLLIGYTIKVLLSLTKVYLSEELSRQRSIIIVFTTLLFVCSLGVLLIDETTLDFGLEGSHRELTKSISTLLEGILKDAEFRVMPMWSFKILLALFCGFLSMVLIFPGFRFADAHFNVIYHSKAPLYKTLLHANYIAPMFCLSLWIRPLTQNLIAEKSTVNVFGWVEISYETFRVVILLGVCILRLLLFRSYLQSYLDTARWKVENLRLEQGRITILNLRKKISNIFFFYAALGVQYIAPYIILLAVTLLMTCASPPTAGAVAEPNGGLNAFRSSRFGTSLFRGCIAFICWWVCFTNAITSGFGAVLKEFI